MNILSILHAPVDTNGYYIAGYAIFFGVMILYLASLFIRNRNLKQEYQMLIDLDQED